jgi:hypothetical protein
MRSRVSSRVRPGGVLAIVLAGVVAALIGAPTARAGLRTGTATQCDDPALEHPFTPWADLAPYVLAPNGIAQGGAQWTLNGGAAPAPGNEWYYVHGANETSSFSLPDGSSATTAAMCVGLDYPTLRFFARNDGAPLSALKVQVLFKDFTGSTDALTIGTVLAGAGWQPMPPLPVVANLLPLVPGGDQTAVAFRFTPTAGGDWSIDDVYVDPWRHG